MDDVIMFNDVYKKLKQKRSILFSKDSDCLKTLYQMIESSSKDVLLQWVFNCIERTLVKIEETYPLERRPRIAYEQAILWCKKEIKMPIVKQAILRCHAAARDIQSLSDQALIHAIGQGLSTIHVKSHAMGFPIYELTSIVRNNIDDFEKIVRNRIENYIHDLAFINDKNASLD